MLSKVILNLVKSFNCMTIKHLILFLTSLKFKLVAIFSQFENQKKEKKKSYLGKE